MNQPQAATTLTPTVRASGSRANTATSSMVPSGRRMIVSLGGTKVFCFIPSIAIFGRPYSGGGGNFRRRLGSSFATPGKRASKTARPLARRS